MREKNLLINVKSTTPGLIKAFRDVSNWLVAGYTYWDGQGQWEEVVLSPGSAFGTLKIADEAGRELVERILGEKGFENITVLFATGWVVPQKTKVKPFKQPVKKIKKQSTVTIKPAEGTAVVDPSKGVVGPESGMTG